MSLITLFFMNYDENKKYGSNNLKLSRVCFALLFNCFFRQRCTPVVRLRSSGSGFLPALDPPGRSETHCSKINHDEGNGI